MMNNNMNKKKMIQIFILVIIFLSMLTIIFVSRDLFFNNNQSYQPPSSTVKVKASQKTYSRFIALNQLPSPTATEPTPSLSITEELEMPTPSLEVSPSDSLTPTEIILVKAVSSTINPEELTSTTTPTEENIEIPASGFYQNLQWLFIISTLIIFFSFIL